MLPHTETEIKNKYASFLEALGVKTPDDAKKLSTEKLVQANKVVVEDTYYASYDIGTYKYLRYPGIDPLTLINPQDQLFQATM